MSDLHDRRMFLHAAAAAGAAWVVADVAHVEDALAWAAQQVAGRDQRALSVLTREQAEVIDALTSRILPSVEGRPGAHEAGVVYFIDRSLSTFNAAQRKRYTDGVRDLNRRAGRKWKETAGFAALAPARQDELHRAIEKTPFFQVG